MLSPSTVWTVPLQTELSDRISPEILCFVCVQTFPCVGALPHCAVLTVAALIKEAESCLWGGFSKRKRFRLQKVKSAAEILLSHSIDCDPRRRGSLIQSRLLGAWIRLLFLLCLTQTDTNSSATVILIISGSQAVNLIDYLIGYKLAEKLGKMKIRA